MGFLSNIINDAKPQAPLPMRVALSVSPPRTASDPVIIASTETTPDDTAFQVESQNSAERPVMRITEYDSNRSRSRDVSISDFRQSSVPKKQQIPPYHQPPIPNQDEANEQSVSPMPEADTSDNGNISTEKEDFGLPPTEYSEQSTSHRQAKNMPITALAPIPSITSDKSGDGVQLPMMAKPISDAIISSSKPDEDTHAPSYILSEQPPLLKKTRQTSNRQTNNLPTDVSAPAPSITSDKSGDGTQPPMSEVGISDAVTSSLKSEAETHTPSHIPREQSIPLEQAQQTSTQQLEIDRRKIETFVAQPAHHPVSTSTPSIPTSITEETVSPEQSLLQSNSSSVSRMDFTSSNNSLTKLKPIETASQQAQVTLWGPSYPPTPERKPEPTVQIGQVDILVSAPETARPQSDSQLKPRNIASRRYLRRL
jgi:hypothetical protein